MTKTKNLTSQVDGARTYFECPEAFVATTLEVYLNGVRQERGQFFVEVLPVGFNTDFAPRVGDELQVQYEVTGPADFYLIEATGIDPNEP